MKQNHVGYPLDRESVPLCLHVDRSDEEQERLCLMNETSGVIEKFRWADRNFTVPLQTIDDFITSFLLKEEENKSKILCEDVQKRALQKNFVLYNAFCKETADSKEFTARQYYRKREGKKNFHES